VEKVIQDRKYVLVVLIVNLLVNGGVIVFQEKIIPVSSKFNFNLNLIHSNLKIKLNFFLEIILPVSTTTKTNTPTPTSSNPLSIN
jgi:hypothetical protein